MTVTSTVTAYDRLHKMRHDIEQELRERAALFQNQHAKRQELRGQECRTNSAKSGCSAEAFQSKETAVIDRINALIDGAMMDKTPPPSLA